MSKRSRSERRAGQQERALATFDLAAIEKIVAQSPRSAVAAVTRALASPPSDPTRAAELAALAARLCKQLRRDGEIVPVLAVTAAGGRRTTALRREEALAAFAAGDDEVVAQLAAADEAIAAALGPLLQAVRGEVVGPPTAAPPLRALQAAARAVSHAVRGELDQARSVVHHIPYARRVEVLGEEIAVAAGLTAPGRGLQSLEYLERSPQVPRSSEVRRLMGAEALLDAEEMARIPPSLAAHPELMRRVLPARLAGATSPGTVAEVIRQAGVDAFDASERPAAALYLGFAQIRADPAAASRSLDRAIALGADMIEALRGKMLAALARTDGPRRDWEREDGDLREAATAADRLAHALERTPRGAPLAAMAGKMAVLRWLDAGNGQAALASIARARPHADAKLLDELVVLEADALALRSPEEADRRLAALLAASPGNVEAWKKRAELAELQGDKERADAILLEAAEATQDPALAVEARSIRSERGEIAPFEGFVPGVATAGALARELSRTTREGVDTLPLAAACRDALGPAARLAFDAAGVAIAVLDDVDGVAQERLRAAMLAWRSSPRDLARLAAVAAYAGFGSGVLAATRVLDDEKDAPALTAITEALAVAGEGKLVGRLLPRVAAALTRERVALLKTVAAGAKGAQIPGVAGPEEAARELDLVLAPELSIVAYESDELDEEADEAEASTTSSTRSRPARTGSSARSSSRSASRPRRPRPSRSRRRRRFEQQLLAPGGLDSPAVMQMLRDLLREIGVEAPADLLKQKAKKRR